MRREKDMMKSENECHLKTLSTKLLYLKITQLTHENLKVAMQELYKFKLMSKNKERALKRICSIITNKEKFTLRKTFKSWYINAFDFVRHNESIQQLTAKKADFKTSSKFFYLWRSAYFDSLRKYDSKLESITLIKEITTRKEQLKIRQALSVWKNRVQWRN